MQNADSDSRADSRTSSIVLKMCIQIDFELLITKNLLLENLIKLFLSYSRFPKTTIIHYHNFMTQNSEPL